MGETRRRPATIDEVIVAFDEVVEWAKEEKSPIGYFPAVYRGVTVRVKEEVEAGHFVDCERMVRFDVTFANRYLDALYGWRAGEEISGAWKVSFVAATDPQIERKVTILQHLLLGVNAHMNLDLGCAASAIAPGAALPSLEPDFNAINLILDDLVNKDRLAVERLSPVLHLLDRVGGLSNLVVQLDIEQRREKSWRVAERLAVLEGRALADEIVQLDGEVVGQSDDVIDPPMLFDLMIDVVKPHEEKDVCAVIDALLGTAPAPLIDVTDAAVATGAREQSVR